MPLLLTDAECSRLVGMADAVAAVKDAYEGLATGRSVLADRMIVRMPTGWMRVLPGALPGRDVFGYKEFHLVGGAVRHTTFLYGATDGRLRAVLDSGHLTGLRTGATAALAADLLAPERVETVAVIGSGKEAAAQLAALLVVRRPEAVRVFSPNPARRADFADRMTRELGVGVRAVGSLPAACAGSQVVLVATRSHGTPVLRAADVPPGAHVSSIGSTLPEQRELASDVFAAAARILVDTPQQLTEAGDLLAARADGAITGDRVTELGAQAAAPVPVRAPGEITVFSSLGTGLQDVALAEVACRKAEAVHGGRALPDLAAARVL
ncbi:ornithine cyclodeaminase [Actinomadura sp. NBRC 104412]|uniref:ornithine cyclodeaminase family protein n=1 Tax=Actinomadura sp. NBRC 104412 TaxID=3032203 RepID=UPI0024A1EA00|nr:hypothetical protein [Actinomadura sp. NBRC 104412]GLZ07512.1 ornithine cyclodeaminase [Actinomadura sp. NBRC 104412]